MSSLEQSVFVSVDATFSCAQPFHDESRKDFAIDTLQHGGGAIVLN